MMVSLCVFLMCACGSSASGTKQEPNEPVAPQDVVIGEYELAGVTLEVSDDIESYLSASIEEELSEMFGEEQLFINADNSFERKCGDEDIDSGTWEKGENNTLITTGKGTMEFRYDEKGTILVKRASEDDVISLGKDFAFIYKKK